MYRQYTRRNKKRKQKRKSRKTRTMRGGNIPTFHVLLCTGGKPHINDMLNSLKGELLENDAITIVFDGVDPSSSKIDESTMKEFKCPVHIIKEDKALGFWGHGARNKHQSHLKTKTTFILNADDDDTYIPGSFSILRQKCTDPSVLYMAKLTYTGEKENVIPGDPVFRYGNLSTQNGIIPFDLAGKGHWKEKYGGDFDYYTDLKNTGVQIKFIDNIIYLKASHTAAVCAIMIKEEPYVDEWIQYYIYGLGFSHVYIYDNSEENSLKDLSSKYPGKVTIRHYPGKAKQVPAYNDFLEKNRNHYRPHRWCAFFDCDEFLVLKKNSTVIPFLTAHCVEGGLAINWYLFGDSNLKEYVNEPVTKRFTMRQNSVNDHIKTIIVCDDVSVINCLHSIAGFKDGKHLKDTNGKVLNSSTNKDGPVDLAVLHHYVIKTKPEFTIKKSRGRADPTSSNDLQHHGFFDTHNHNEVKDDSAYKIYEKAEEEYKKVAL